MAFGLGGVLAGIGSIISSANNNKGNSNKGNGNSSSKPNSNPDRDSIVNQMQSNSDKWANASAEERKELESANQALGSQLGGSFNSQTGTWTDNKGNNLYNNNQGSNGQVVLNPYTGQYEPDTGQNYDYSMLVPGMGGGSFGNNGYMDQYYQAQQAQMEAQKKRTEALLGQIDTQKQTVNSDAEEMARQAYINQMLGQKQAKEQMAASGLGNTGYSESSQLGLQTAYQQALNGINQNKTNALTNLDNAKTQAQTTGNADLASIESSYNQMMAQMMQQMEQEAYNRQLQAQQMAMQQNQNDWNKQLAMAQLNGRFAQDEYNSYMDRMDSLVKLGVYTPEVAQWYGYDDVNSLYSALNDANIRQAQMQAAYNNIVNPKKNRSSARSVYGDFVDGGGDDGGVVTGQPVAKLVSLPGYQGEYTTTPYQFKTTPEEAFNSQNLYGAGNMLSLLASIGKGRTEMIQQAKDKYGSIGDYYPGKGIR